jgi:hypothetical protein
MPISLRKHFTSAATPAVFMRTFTIFFFFDIRFVRQLRASMKTELVSVSGARAPPLNRYCFVFAAVSLFQGAKIII